MTRLCCPPSCCPGGVKGASAVLAVAAGVIAAAVVTHLLALAAVLGVAAACWVIAVAVAAVVARYTVRPLAVAAEPEPYRLAATVIPEAVQAAPRPELAASVPAIENHVHYHLHIGDREAAAVFTAIPGQAGDALTEGKLIMGLFSSNNGYGHADHKLARELRSAKTDAERDKIARKDGHRNAADAEDWLDGRSAHGFSEKGTRVVSFFGFRR